jgi:hypothetical protein
MGGIKHKVVSGPWEKQSHSVFISVSWENHMSAWHRMERENQAAAKSVTLPKPQEDGTMLIHLLFI